MATASSAPHVPQTKQPERRILVCLDRSTFSAACVPYAVSLAKTFGSAITLVHVLHPPPRELAGPQTNDALGWEISRQEARRYLERMEREAAQALGEPVDVRLEQGHPAERIVELAREQGANLTMLGSHGEAGATPWSLGSTVQQVLAVARGSVFIVHSSSMTTDVVSLRRILVPLDGSVRAESVLPTAVRLACAYRAELLLVHVVQEPLTTAVLCTAEDLELARTLAAHLVSSATRYLEQLQQALTQDGTVVRVLVVQHANERHCLLEISQQEEADLIVFSAHGSACNPARSFGSVAVYLLTHARVPLLVLQDLPDSEARRAQDADAHVTPPRPLRASYTSENV